MNAAESRVEVEHRIVRVGRPIASLPALSPRLLVPRAWGPPLPFPFSDPRTRFTYLGRGAVFHAARLLGLAGEEVLVPAYHHGVEVEALVAAGVRPRFYGVKRDFSIDFEDLGARIGERTRAIYVIHYAGFPQRIDDVLAMARMRNLKVIEDCALSLLSADGSRPLGTRGDAGIFCLHKSLPVPHGGALWRPEGWDGSALEPTHAVATAHQLASSLMLGAERRGGAAQRLSAGVRRAAGLVRRVKALPVDRTPVGTRHFVPGEEARDVAPVVLRIARALNFGAIVEQRRRNYYALLARLRDVAPPVVHELGAGVCPLFYPLWCEDKPRVHARLSAAGIESIDFWSVGSPLVADGEFPEVEALRRHVLELPVHQDLDRQDMESMAGAVRDAIGAGRHAP